MNNCKHLYSDWCHKPSRCIELQEKCIDYYNGKCPDFEIAVNKGVDGK
jgi:hypothetical protein